MSRRHATRQATALARPMRAILILAAVLVFLAGFQLNVFPLRTAEWFAWTVDPPMTAVFLGAAYWSSAVLEVSGARSPGWGRARLTVWTVLVFTTLTLAVTLVHLDRFHLGADQATSARLITRAWIAIYAGVPVGMVVALVLQARSRMPIRVEDAARPLPSLLRWLLTVLAVALLGCGLALLAAPDHADVLWAWPLTPLTARAVGAWLVGLGWAAAHARLLDDASQVWPLGPTGAAFVVLECLALVRYGGVLDWWGWQTAAYLVGLAWIGAVATWLLLLRAAGAAAPGSSP